jgi:hypothetical protein
MGILALLADAMSFLPSWPALCKSIWILERKFLGTHTARLIERCVAKALTSDHSFCIAIQQIICVLEANLALSCVQSARR